jgi:hypothetical protein
MTLTMTSGLKPAACRFRIWFLSRAHALLDDSSRAPTSVQLPAALHRRFRFGRRFMIAPALKDFE